MKSSNQKNLQRDCAKDGSDAAPVGSQPTSSGRKRVSSAMGTNCSRRKKRAQKEDELPLELPLQLKFSILQDEIIDLRKEYISLKTNFERINGQVNFLLSFLGIQESQTVGVNREAAVQPCNEFQMDDNDLRLTVDTGNPRSEHAQSLFSTVVQKRARTCNRQSCRPSTAR